MNPVIEFYRGVAALMVMTSHFAHILTGSERGWMNFLWTGVDLFFVISGFVFAPQIFSGKIAPLGFFVRRFFRIYPLYILSVGLYFVLTPSAPEKIHYLLNHLSFLHTIHSKEEAFFFNPAYWSLPPEIEFYLLLPLLALWLNSVRKLIGLTVLALIVHCTLFALSKASFGLFEILGLHLPGLLIEFFIGVLAYRFKPKEPLSYIFSIPLLAVSISVLVCLGWFFIRFGDAGLTATPALQMSFNLLCAIAYGTILCVTVNLTANHIPNKKWATLSTLAGQSSYGVYLFHNAVPIIFAGIAISATQRFVLFSLVTVLLAIVLNRLYEGPLHRYGIELANRISGIQKTKS